MTTSQNIDYNRPFWYLFFKPEHFPERYERFIEDGCWEFFESDDKEIKKNKFLGYLHDMQIGDRIVIFKHGGREWAEEFKVKHNVEINKFISYTLIRAIGEITERCNSNIVGVNWEVVENSRKWYSRANYDPIWNVHPDSIRGWGKNLIDFTFLGKDQNLGRLYDELKSKKGKK